MIRARLLASVGVVLGIAALWPAASTQAQNPSSLASSAHEAFDQQTFWRTQKVYCDSCHFGPFSLPRNLCLCKIPARR